MKALQQLFGTRYPLIQAPMAGVQRGELAAAVAAAGGLGSLPCAMLDAASIRREWAVIRSQTANPINLNFFCHTPPAADEAVERHWRECFAPYYAEYGIDPATIQAGPGRRPFDDEMADLVCELRPEVVSFHFGLPTQELLQRVRSSGAKVISSATRVDEAQWLAERGVDAIIAQGIEAGGHRGVFLSDEIDTQVGTFALLPQIVQAVDLPVIAAGGIASAEGVAAALQLGAAGVQVGTAYLLCPEVQTSAVHRAALRSDAARFTALTNLFSGRPARGIVNRMMRELGPISSDAPPFPLASSASAPLRAKAEAQGNGDFTPLWAGQNVTGCREIAAAELTCELMRLIE